MSRKAVGKQMVFYAHFFHEKRMKVFSYFFFGFYFFSNSGRKAGESDLVAEVIICVTVLSMAIVNAHQRA